MKKITMKPAPQKGFAILELMVATLIATSIGIGLLRQEITQFEEDISQLVAAEILTLHDAARNFYSDTGVWPDQANNCADALNVLRAGGYIIGFNENRWGTGFITTCPGAPALNFLVSAAAPVDRYAAATAARVLSPQLAGNVVTSSIPIPGAEPALGNFLSRVAVPGAPEVNRMETNIDMDGNDINNVGTITGPGGGAVTIDNLNINTAMAWGDSRLNVDPNGRGDIDFGINNGNPGSPNSPFFNFYSQGLLLGNLHADNSDTLVVDQMNLEVGQNLDVVGDALMQGGLDVTGNFEVDGDSTFQGPFQANDVANFAGDVTMDNDLDVGGTLSAEIVDFRHDVNLCTDDLGPCAVRVERGDGTEAIAMGYNGTGAQIWAGGPDANVNDALASLDILADLAAFSGDITATGIIQAGDDVRTQNGDSLSRAVQDVAILNDGETIPKPQCDGSAPHPRIYTALAHVAAGETPKLIYQAAAHAVDTGSDWTVEMHVVDEDGNTGPLNPGDPNFAIDREYRRILTIVKCEITP